MCAVDSCDSPAITRGWCDKHYRRWRSNGDPEVSRRQPRAGSVCAVEGCDRQRHSAAGHCSTHDTRMRKHGDPDERVGSDGKKDDLRYSLDPSYYAPRCSGDHIRFDKHRE